MSRVTPRVLRGFRDYLPQKMIPRQRMLNAIESTFQRFGFVPLMTPALEYLEILTGKYGDEGENLLYRFQDQGGRDVALRYDLTVPLARVVAQHNTALPWRRYQIAPVWRAEKPQRGRFREFVQCDADIIGASEMCADAELVQLACELLESLDVKQYVVRLNNRKVLSGLMEKIGVATGKDERGVCQTIDKLPKIKEEKTRELLRTENGLDEQQVQTIFDLLSLTGKTESVLGQLREMFPDGVGALGVAELSEVFAIAKATGANSRVELDLSIARGLDYYTGTIYETFLSDLPSIGAVMGGGRYDGLIGVFKGAEIPALGISLGIDRLLEALIELNVLEEKLSITNVLVSVFGADTAGYAGRIARELRRANLACELYAGYTKIGKQFRYADRRAMRWVVVAGTDEAAREEVTVKDLASGEQQTVAFAELVSHLKSASAE